MAIRLMIIAALATLLAGCQVIEGTYYPGCAAYAGDKVKLSDGNFVWDKFTDQVLVDDDGNMVDQFPDYPRRGTFTVHGNEVRMNFVVDQAVKKMYVHEHEDRLLLLTDAEFVEWRKTGRIGACVLTREEKTAN